MLQKELGKCIEPLVILGGATITLIIITVSFSNRPEQDTSTSPYSILCAAFQPPCHHTFCSSKMHIVSLSIA